LIEAAYTLGEGLGLDVWCEDEAGPYQTTPQPGGSWQPEGQPARQDHEYLRNGTAKLLTLFHPRDGQVRVEGVRSCTNVVLHGWLQAELTAILETLPSAPPPREPEAQRALWLRWQAGLTRPCTLRQELPPLRLLLVLDNLAGHTTPDFVDWCMDHGILLLYTPLGGSWLNMAESIQRILRRRALDGTHPETPEEIIAWLKAVAVGWNRDPTPFVWGGKRAARRARQRTRRHAQGGSGAYTRRAVARPRPTKLDEWRRAQQVTH
jgi:DDE superfamily endonuclease